MTLRSVVLRATWLAVSGVGLVAGASAQQPTPTRPMNKPAVRPADYIPPSDTPANQLVPIVLKVQSSNTTTADGTAALPKALAESRTAYGKLRDYTGHLIRQERVNGKLLPEQTCELRVRLQPFAVNVRLTGPKELSGQETSYHATRSTTTVRYRAGGVEGIKYGYVTLPVDDAKVLSTTRHPVTDTGLAAVLDRVEKVLATEKRLNHSVSILMSDYLFAGRPVTRYEVFADQPHPNRYAHRCVLYIDKETKLPVRFEAYDQPAAGRSTSGELLEMQSFVGIKTNTGLGDTTFER